MKIINLQEESDKKKYCVTNKKKCVKCTKYVKIPEICNFRQKGRICHINIFTYFS